MMHIRQHLLAAQPRMLTANTVTVPAAAQWEVPRVDRGPGSRGRMRTSLNSRAGAESGRSTHMACPEMIYTLQPLPGADVPGSVTSGTTENLQTRTRIEPTVEASSSVAASYFLGAILGLIMAIGVVLGIA